MERFNPPPHWPEPPADEYLPDSQWSPDPSWGEVPAGWRQRYSDLGLPPSPIQASEKLPAHATKPPRADTYPVSVILPGQLTDPPRRQKDRESGSGRRARLSGFISRRFTLLATLVGILAIVVSLGALWAVLTFANSELPAQDAALVAPSVMSPEPGTPAVNAEAHV